MANPFVLNFDSPNLGGIFQNNEARRREDRSTVQNAFNTLTRHAIEGSVDNDPLYADPIANAEEKVKRYTQAGMLEQAKQARTIYNNLVKIAADKDAAALNVAAQKDLQKTELDAKDKQNILTATVTRLGQLTDSYDNLITQRAKLAAGDDLGNISSAAVAQIKDIDKRLAGLKSAFGGIVSTLPPELQSNYLLGQDTPPVPPVTQRASSVQPVTTTQPVETPGQLTQGILPAGGGGVGELVKDVGRNAYEKLLKDPYSLVPKNIRDAISETVGDAADVAKAYYGIGTSKLPVPIEAALNVGEDVAEDLTDRYRRGVGDPDAEPIPDILQSISDEFLTRPSPGGTGELPFENRVDENLMSGLGLGDEVSAVADPELYKQSQQEYGKAAALLGVAPLAAPGVAYASVLTLPIAKRIGVKGVEKLVRFATKKFTKPKKVSDKSMLNRQMELSGQATSRTSGSLKNYLEIASTATGRQSLKDGFFKYFNLNKKMKPRQVKIRVKEIEKQIQKELKNPKLTEIERANLLDKLQMTRNFDALKGLWKTQPVRSQATRVSDKSRWEILF